MRPSVQFTRQEYDYGGRDRNVVFGARTGEDEGVGVLRAARLLDEHRPHPVAAVPSQAAAEDALRFAEGPQGTLLHSRPAVPWTVAEMAVSPGYEHTVGTLLGLAGLHGLRTTGRLPEASSDLSAHSSRMVAHLVGRGLIPAPEPDDRNRITKEDAQGMIDDAGVGWLGDPIRPREARRAENFTRGLLRAARPKRAAPTGEQGRLW